MAEEQNILTPEEEAELNKFLTSNAPSPDILQNVHKFLHDVSISKDTIKTGFLTPEELGIPKHPVRALHSLALISEDIMDNDFLTKHFKKEAEITTATSLSKEAKLLELAVINRRQLEDVTKKPKENTGWFKKKNKEVQ